MKYPTNSSSFSITFKISFGSLLVASPIFGQADTIVAGSNHVLQPVTMGNNVTLPVPSVDRGRGDPRNLMCVVTDINTETQQFKLATRYDLLNGSFSRNQFLPCTSNTLLLDSVDLDTEISVRQAARELDKGL
jgi:hypothetical protein